jgi:hypothetical protein
MERTGLYAEEVEETGIEDEEYEDDEEAAPEAPTVDYLSWGAVFHWTLATAVGVWAGLLLILLVVSTGSGPALYPYNPEPVPHIQIAGLYAFHGGLVGLCVGVLQWLVWFRHTRRELAWIRATWVGWACAGATAYLIYDFMPIGNFAPGAFTGQETAVFDYVIRDSVAGIIAGAVTGLFQGLAFLQVGINRLRFWLFAMILVHGSAVTSGALYLRTLDKAYRGDLGLFTVFMGTVVTFLIFGGLSGLALWAMVNRAKIGGRKLVVITAALLPSSLLFAYVVSAAQTGSLFGDPPRINITRHQYEEALTKWRNQNIEEYEITVDTDAWLGGTVTLKVSDKGRKIIRVDRPPNRTYTEEDMQFLRSDTVEGMFEEIDAMLNNAEIIHTGSMSGKGHFYMRYRVHFDDSLGYPVYLEGEPVLSPGAYVNHADWKKTVTHFKILKRGNATAP